MAGQSRGLRESVLGGDGRSRREALQILELEQRELVLCWVQSGVLPDATEIAATLLQWRHDAV